MKKIISVSRHEFITVLSRPVFLIFAFGIPVIALLVVTGISIFKGDSAGGDASGQEDVSELEIEGYVDQGGLVSVIPDDVPSDILVAFSDEEQALAALESGEITAYYVIPEDYVQTGELYYVYPNASPLSSGGQDWVMRWTLLVNILGGDAKLASRAWNPMNLEATNLAPELQYGDAYAEEDCSRPGFTCESNVLIRYIPPAIVALFYIFLSTASGLLIRNVSSEKENRVIEVMMSSVTPRQLLTGKLVGLGIVSLLQTMVWIGCGYAMFSLGGQTLNVPENFTLPASILIWSVAFFILGYAVYASLMAGAGALVPKVKEANQAAWVGLMPLLIGYMLGIFISIETPHGALSIGLSMFPLTAPVVMPMRIIIGGMPFWQPLVSAGLLALTAIFVMRAVARMFHAQILLSGQPFSVKRYFRALVGRA